MSRTMLGETVERQRIQRTSTSGMSALLVRVQSEYLEMPGLKLTEAQARRLWGLDANSCRAVLATLIERGFLRRSADGSYVRAGS
jgi:predicted transcriptional regulator of viral defense system